MRGMVVCVLTAIATIGLQNLNAQVTLSGTITDKQSVMSLSGANIVIEKTTKSAVSGSSGEYSLKHVNRGLIRLKVSYIGYKTAEISLVLQHDSIVNVALEPAPVLGEEVNIQATRAQRNYPTTYASISSKEIKEVNLGKDMPYILQSSPSVVVTSDAGNGIGYTGISIRGTDLTRINVTINGVPLNDAESQGVWFVDLPDLASSTENIQIQRGVGTSTNGSGAFGASINLLTSTLNQDPYGELDISGGSYNTLKTTLRFGTGLMANRFCVDGRLSYLHSDGYIDRAFSNLKSYFLSAGYFGKSTTVKLINFSGFERTYQSWYGVPGDSLATNRTYNPAGQYTDKSGKVVYYDNQTDNYEQDHYQLIFSQRLMANWNLSAALHYTKGKGYYENYEQNQLFSAYGLSNVILGTDTITSTNLVNRKMMDNDFYGVTFSTNLSVQEKLKITAGGAWSSYNGHHFGKVIWAEFASDGDNNRNYYYNQGVKKDFNIYTKISYQLLKQLSLFADLQYRFVSYKMDGKLDDQRALDQNHRFNFFNPKAGLYFTFSGHHSLYYSFGVANREPSRNNYKDADPQHTPTFETLYDNELGYNFTLPNFTLNANFYYMRYRDQLVLTGKINNVGEAIMVNVPHSYRLGLEISAGIKLFRKLKWDVNATFSRNSILNFTEYVDKYDSVWNIEGQLATSLGETNIAFSPQLIVGSMLTCKPVENLSISLNTRYIGRQYMDNTNSRERSLSGYFVNGISVGYAIKTGLFNEVCLSVAVNNLFNVKYSSNGWVYQYYFDNRHYESNGFYPQALLNFLVGLTVKI